MHVVMFCRLHVHSGPYAEQQALLPAEPSPQPVNVNDVPPKTLRCAVATLFALPLLDETYKYCATPDSCLSPLSFSFHYCTHTQKGPIRKYVQLCLAILDI